MAMMIVSMTCALVACRPCLTDERAPTSFQSTGVRPNIVLIMTDDQGWGEVGFHGNKVIKTPNLDRFAAEGTELTNFYVSPMCTPTRSSLMTGRYHFRTGAHDTYIGRSNMNPDETTIAEVFSDAGYRTGIFGKWHLGENYPMRAIDQGFQTAVVHGGGGIGQFADYPGNSYWNPTLQYNDTFRKANGYCTDIFIDESIQFMKDSGEQPFFCYLPVNVPHSPFDVANEFRADYDKQNLTDPDGRNWVAPIYGMITQFDGAFGRLLEAVEKMGRRENTIIIFMSDNGPNSTYFTAGLRAKKSSVYENGIRSPFVIQWPKGMKGGRKLNDPAMHIDLLPTLAEACGIKLPANLKVDGKSILRLLTGDVRELPERYVFMQHNRGNLPTKYKNGMVRNGPWKAVGHKGTPDAFELYNIDQDPGEKNDLASQNPDKVKAFVREYEAWFDDVTAELVRNRGMPHPIELNPIQKIDYRFTWQDWWGDKTGWRPNNYGRWRITNPGLIERFDVTVVPHRQHHGEAATMKFIWQGKTVEKNFDNLPASVVLENVEISRGTGFMEAQLHSDGRMWGAFEVRIKAHDAATAYPPVELVTKTTRKPVKPRARKPKTGKPGLAPTQSMKLPEVRGQFIRIELPGNGRVLSLAEVGVFENGKNVALKKKATQSTVAFGGKPERAVDGDADGDYHNGSVTHTEINGHDPWWELDLGRLADVEQIVIYNRTDGGWRRLDNFTLRILDARRDEVFSKEKIREAAVISLLRTGVKSSQVMKAVRNAPTRTDLDGNQKGEKLFPGVKTDFRGYDRYDRIKTAAGHFAVVCPKEPAPGRPWLWRSMFWEAIKKVSDADLKLVDEGYHVVLAHGDVAGHPRGNANIDAAYEMLTTEYGFSKKCSNMSSMSRGTLSLFRWASANPEKVDSIYVDNGVCNVLSWPAGKLVPGSGSQASGAPSSWADFKKKFGYESDEEAIKTKESPIDQLEALAKAGVPILMVCGNKDTAVPYEENDAIMEQRYSALGGSIKVIVEDKGHSHGMNDPAPVLEFIRKHTSATNNTNLHE